VPTIERWKTRLGRRSARHCDGLGAAARAGASSQSAARPAPCGGAQRSRLDATGEFLVCLSFGAAATNPGRPQPISPVPHAQTHRHANSTAPRRGDSAGGKPAGGANGTRTRDPLLAKQVLFQLSYSPFMGDRRSPWTWAKQRGWSGSTTFLSRLGHAAPRPARPTERSDPARQNIA
jgi:hypothetical protein